MQLAWKHSEHNFENWISYINVITYISYLTLMILVSWQQDVVYDEYVILLDSNHSTSLDICMYRCVFTHALLMCACLHRFTTRIIYTIPLKSFIHLWGCVNIYAVCRQYTLVWNPTELAKPLGNTHATIVGALADLTTTFFIAAPLFWFRGKLLVRRVH